MNYYTKFCFELIKPADASKESIAEWFSSLCDWLISDEFLENYGTITIEELPFRFFLTSDDCGDMRAAIKITQSFLNTFNISEGIYIGYAKFAGRYVFNEFGGGAVVITKDNVLSVDSELVIKIAEDEGIKVIK